MTLEKAPLVATHQVPEIVPRLLGELTGAIDWIDGGCYICVGKFVEEANEALERLDLSYRYEFRQECHIGARVWVVHQCDPEVE